jgi:hypothetical protein
MALHKRKQLYVLGKLRFSSIKPIKMIYQFLILFIHGNFIQSDAKKCKHTRQEKITIFRGKEKKRYFYIHRRPILYQTENHDHY